MTTSTPSGLTGVSETALLTLKSRAAEARRPDGIIDDPVALALLDTIEHDFTKFGTSRQDMALRAKAFDIHTRRYLDTHPDATVVALAEGFQTSFYRLDAQTAEQRFRWLTVDLPAVAELRSQLLPASERVSICAQSALDYSWMDQVDGDGGVFITAEGLLMYLEPEEALGLIAECAKRFPGGHMLFDLPPYWFAALSRLNMLRPSRRYSVPTMPFHATPATLGALADTVPGIVAVQDVPMPKGRGAVLNALLATAHRVRVFDRVRGALTLLQFG
ncbi:MAG: class I SAM-dependent methyltransferase [Mycobacterium sp.]